ncbi:hypothetical protein GSI_14173 [Ganoderma sinense ZZ0214-1]|uniref:Uncharacterized protein n=1 Tax=Ganoderma sinense ZZ0214-1 TaxID=1077348 RepID=A0A2G8RSC7_9APHY|nr:hypothetical protein GSI_14173 [Ganoderma sinense ZZ0214-1]
MSLMQFTQPEALLTARHPSMQFDMKRALSSRGHTKRKPTGDFIPVGQENYPPSLPTKRVCASPSVQQQWNAPTASGAPESEAPHPFVEFLLQNRIAALAQTQSRPSVENIPQAHASSMWTSPSMPGTFPSQPVDPQHDVDGSSQERSPSEKAEVAKGKQPDRRRHKSKASRHAPKPEAASTDIMAQQFLSFLTHNLIAEQMALGAEVTAATCAPDPEPQQCARSGFGYPEAPVLYASPFEDMLVQTTPWPAAAAVMQEMRCECSICVRALAKRLEDAAPSIATPFKLSPHPEPEPRVEEPPPLEPYFTLDDGAAPPSLSEARLGFPADIVPMPAPFPSYSHQFFPHMQEAPAPPGGRLESAYHVF